MPTPLQRSVAKAAEPEVKEVKKKQSHYLFISDSKAPARLRSQFENLVSFSKSKFANRSPQDMTALGCSDLWVDITNKHARAWLERWLPVESHVCIALYKDKRSKWLEDVAPFVLSTCKKSVFDNIDSIGFDEMHKVLEAGLLRIHTPPSIAARIFSCGSNIIKRGLVKK